MANKWNEVFKEYKKVTFAQIRDYVVSEKPEYEETLRGNVNADMSFLTIKKAFYQKYFKQYIPVAKPKKPSMKDWAAAK